MPSHFEKTVGRIKVEVSEPSPRWVRIFELDDRGRAEQALPTMRVEEARDLHYALGRALAFVENEDRTR